MDASLKPYRAREMMQILGLSMGQFYRQGVRERYHRVHKLPRPITTKPLVWDRASVDAWRFRHHPGMPMQACNDLAPAPPPSSDAEHQAELHEIYGTSST